MNETTESISLSPDLEFSYSQFFVYDAGLTSPACEWTDVHSKQGFARRDHAVAIGTLLEFGTASVCVTFGAPTDLKRYERAVAVPLEIMTGAVSIDGPEESGGKRVVSAATGHYRATIAQRAIDDTREEIKVWLEKVHVPVRRSELLVVDEGLEPPVALLETANAPSSVVESPLNFGAGRIRSTLKWRAGPVSNLTALLLYGSSIWLDAYPIVDVLNIAIALGDIVLVTSIQVGKADTQYTVSNEPNRSCRQVSFL